MDPRARMVEEIRKKYGLNSPQVFSAMLKVPREKFVPQKYSHMAYSDAAVSIGHGQTISQPYTVAFMTDLLNLLGNEKVLEIGAGSGYQAALLSLLADKVYTIERIPELAQEARERLKKLGFKNVEVKTGTGELGWKEKAPFDAILVTAGMSDGTSEELLSQLKVGGVMVAPIGEGDDKTMTKFVKKSKSKIEKTEHGIFHFVPFVEVN